MPIAPGRTNFLSDVDNRFYIGIKHLAKLLNLFFGKRLTFGDNHRLIILPEANHTILVEMRIVAVVIFILVSLVSPAPVYANNNADPVNSSISSSASSLPADGVTTATISVTAKDSLKNPLAGDHITLTAVPAAGLIINGGSEGAGTHTAAADPAGKVYFTVKSRNISPSTVTFTATDVSSQPAVTIGSVWVTFTPSSVALDPSCKDGGPTTAPILTSAISTGPNQITLTWTEVGDPVSYYLVAYGTKSNEYIYGNPNVGGKGTTSYTVGSLNPGTTYYFIVRAGNGCHPGFFSNELSAVAGAVTRLSEPNPTSTPIVTPTPEPTPPPQTPPPTGGPIPTETPIAFAPTLVADSSISTIWPYLVLALFVLGGITVGGIIYWKKKNAGEKTIETIEEHEFENE